MLRDVLACAALALGFIVSQMTLASSHHKAEGAPLVLMSNSGPASSVTDASHQMTEGGLQHFARSRTNRRIKFEHARRAQWPSSHVWLASASSGAALEESTDSEKSSSAITIDPFNARAIIAPEIEIQGALVDDYLFEAYRRLPQKRDAAGDFTWKDPAAAERFGLPLDRYVIGGMDPDFRELIYAAGRSMDAAGIKWSILSAFRDDWRQQIASGFKASTAGSCHGGSRSVGGYGHGRCIDLWTTEGPVDAVFDWIDRVGRKFGLLRPMPGADPAHVSTVGDWRAIAYRLRVERWTASIIAAVSALAGADLAAGLTEVVTLPEWKISPAMASALPLQNDLPARFTARGFPKPGSDD
jgi:hypothetical protein